MSYLARTPCVLLFCTYFDRGGNRRAFTLRGEGGDHFHCTVEPSPGHIRCRQKGRLVKGWFWRMCPHAVFFFVVPSFRFCTLVQVLGSIAPFFCALVPVLGVREHLPKFCEPPKLSFGPLHNLDVIHCASRNYTCKAGILCAIEGWTSHRNILGGTIFVVIYVMRSRPVNK